jgi:hypothetical protein
MRRGDPDAGARRASSRAGHWPARAARRQTRSRAAPRAQGEGRDSGGWGGWA